MQTTEQQDHSGHNVCADRARLRAAGLRRVQIWVPDVRAPCLAEEARRQSLRTAQTAAERNALDFVEDTADLGEAE
jgi:hypothetical protein